MLSLTLILYLIFSYSFCCKVCLRRYSKRLISLPATSNISSEVAIVLGHGQILHRHSLLFSECNFHLFLCWSSSDTLLSSDWVLSPAHSYAVCTYETRYWTQPRQLAPTNTISTLGQHIYQDPGLTKKEK